jgi:hypothetical protein
MRIHAVVLTVGVVAGLLALLACVPPAPPQFRGMAALRSPVAAGCSLPTFLSKVHFLAQTSPPFSLPRSGFRDAPPVDPSRNVDGPIAGDLADAFNAAPEFFKNQLCNLSGIYIDRTGCTSYDPRSCNGRPPTDALWAFRAFDDAGNSAGEFIGTWLGLWQNGVDGHAPVLSKFETGRLQTLLNWKSNGPRHELVDPDTSTMTMLLVLAHEVGHVFWYDSFVIKPDGSPNPGGQADFGKFCDGTFYSPQHPGEGSWLVLPVGVPPNRWVSFGTTRNYHKPDDVDMASLGFDLDHGRYPNAGDLLHGIYAGIQNGRWASALAAFSPDEDFVETFQLFVLMHAKPPLQHLRVRIPGTRPQPYLDDVPFTFDQRPELVRKSRCFEYLLR